MKLREIILGSLLSSLVGCSSIKPFIADSIESSGNIVGETMKTASIIPETISKSYGLIADSMYDTGSFIENKTKDLRKSIDNSQRIYKEIAPKAPIDTNNYQDIAPLPLE